MADRILKLEPDGWDGTLVVIAEEHSTIGRGGETSIAIDEPSISRKHAAIHLKATGWEIEDTGSSQGTQVNWMRIDAGECVRIEDGDRVELGGMAFMVQDRPRSGTIFLVSLSK